MITYANLSSLFTDIITTLDKLSALQMEKLNAAKQRNLELLDHCMNQEQAFSMSLRGYEQKRNRILKELQLADIPLTQLPSHVPAEKYTEFSKLAESLRHSYEIYTSSEQTARTVLERDLKQIEQALKQRGLDPELTPTAFHTTSPSHTDLKV